MAINGLHRRRGIANLASEAEPRGGALRAMAGGVGEVFLVPFSLLVFLGIHLAPPRPAAPPDSGFLMAMQEVSQPFAPIAAGGIPRVAASPITSNLAHLLPALVVALWFCGFVGVLFAWYVHWRRVAAVVQVAIPLSRGREVEALRRVEGLRGIQQPIRLLLSAASLEPGIFGIVNPVLLWPKGISARLEDIQLEAILAHEVCHVRRRDNLAAAVHMVVEAIFWFNPLVWWLGARLMEERERACDEEVLAAGSDRQSYAESILKTCEFCLESPVACVSGITGADLKKRIVHIMTERLTHKLSVGRKLLLASMSIAAVCGPMVFGLLHAPQTRAQSAPADAGPLPSFEVASIKPNRSGDGGKGAGMIRAQPGRLVANALTTKHLIAFAYNVKDFQISGGPGWINSEKYDIEGKKRDPFVQEAGNAPSRPTPVPDGIVAPVFAGGAVQAEGESRHPGTPRIRADHREERSQAARGKAGRPFPRRIQRRGRPGTPKHGANESHRPTSQHAGKSSHDANASGRVGRASRAYAAFGASIIATIGPRRSGPDRPEGKLRLRPEMDSRSQPDADGDGAGGRSAA